LPGCPGSPGSPGGPDASPHAVSTSAANKVENKTEYFTKIPFEPLGDLDCSFITRAAPVACRPVSEIGVRQAGKACLAAARRIWFSDRRYAQTHTHQRPGPHHGLGVAQGVFRTGLDPIDIHAAISALTFFNVTHQHTFGLIFKGDNRPST